MKIIKGYQCRHCGKIYPYQKYDLPYCCSKCGADLLYKNYYINRGGIKYYYNDGEKFDVYSGVDVKLGPYAKEIKAYKKYFFSKWKVLDIQYKNNF